MRPADTSGPRPLAAASRGATSEDRSPGPIFAAQPPELAQLVSRNFFLNHHMAAGF
jgi:hypothetical protein